MQLLVFRKSLKAGVCLLLTVLCGFAMGELPPGAYEKLKAEAQEVLEIRVTKVGEKREADRGVYYYVCDGEVLSTTRTKAGFQRGDVVRFKTYFVSRKAIESGFVGPASPPLIQVNWRGRIYLNTPLPESEEQPSSEKTVLELAAYGRSFEASKRGQQGRLQGIGTRRRTRRSSR